MEIYVATYCAKCAQLQWYARIGKRCEFCGHATFANVRPPPVFSEIDKRLLRSFVIRSENGKKV